jgi:hypothetical protein
MFNPYENLFGNHINRKFGQVFSEYEVFADGYKNSGVYDTNNTITDKHLELVYYLLYARYGNSTISYIDEEQFKYAVYSTIFMYGPSWEAKLKTQEALRELLNDPDKLVLGAQAIYNHSTNPSTVPSTTDFTPLKTIDDQNTSQFKKGKLDAYAIATELLKADVTEAFIAKFAKLFIRVVQPNVPLWYVEEE